MAGTFVGGNLYDYTPGAGLIVYGSDYSAVVFDEIGASDGVFSVNEVIGLDYMGTVYPVTYLGHSADGGIFFEQFGLNYFVAPAGNAGYGTGTQAAPALVEGEHAICFAKGTHISTPEGARAVETLAAGDRILNASGAAVAIKWIGRQTRHSFFARIENNLPVRIAQGALGEGLPLRDLHVSPDHAMLVQGCLVHASALVNGRSIAQMQHWDGNVEYFHIETESHEIIFAEGAATETFIDNVSREKFDNHAEFAALYPDAQPMAELKLPRISFARQLPCAISSHLDAVADDLMGRMAAAA